MSVEITVGELRKLARTLGGKHASIAVLLTQEDGYVHAEIPTLGEEYEVKTPYGGVALATKTKG